MCVELSVFVIVELFVLFVSIVCLASCFSFVLLVLCVSWCDSSGVVLVLCFLGDCEFSVVVVSIVCVLV